MIENGRILNGKVLLKPLKEPEKTTSGLIYKPVDIVKPKTQAGVVVIATNKADGSPAEVTKGDCILYPPHGFVTVDLREDGEYRLIDQKDILFIWRE